MFKGISIAETTKYISKIDPDKENPTIFHLGAVDAVVENYIKDETTRPPEDGSRAFRIDVSKRLYLFFKFGVKKIDNLADSKGQIMMFESEKFILEGKEYAIVPDSVITVLPQRSRLIPEVAAEVIKINDLSEEEEKN